MKEELISSLKKAALALGIDAGEIKLAYPENPDHGEYSTNLALVYAKKLGKNPKQLAQELVGALEADPLPFVEKIEIAGAGFINFRIKDEFFSSRIIEIVKGGLEYGWSSAQKGKRVMVEYTDPNPFKVFHVGHLMANAIGESMSRLVQSSGSEVIRACYQGDVGLHVAKTIWAIKFKIQDLKFKIEDQSQDVKEKVKWLGEMYVYGSKFDEDEKIQREIKDINKKIFDKSDPEINSIYEKGRTWSLEYFDLIYKRLGTKFDKFFFESEVAEYGMKIVKEFLKKSVFEESKGAIVFKGEEHGLHTRVFVTSQGLPTYETKELGLNMEKFRQFPDLTESVIITANEQNDYFSVLLKAFEFIDKHIAEKTRHMSHGILRFSSGKMSSRKGNIISAEDLLEEIRKLVEDKISDRDFDEVESDKIADKIAIGAIKYTILRQSVGSDVIFDSAASISFEGDSGPYLQYSAVRAKSILERAEKDGLKGLRRDFRLPKAVTMLEKLIVRFPDILERAHKEYAPQHLANYLINLAGEFNSYYAKNVIVDKNEPLSPYRVALTQAFFTTMTNGLWVLGIEVPERM